MRNKDKASAKQLAWEERRNNFMTDKPWTKGGPKGKGPKGPSKGGFKGKGLYKFFHRKSSSTTPVVKKSLTLVFMGGGVESIHLFKNYFHSQN